MPSLTKIIHQIFPPKGSAAYLENRWIRLADKSALRNTKSYDRERQLSELEMEIMVKKLDELGVSVTDRDDRNIRFQYGNMDIRLTNQRGRVVGSMHPIGSKIDARQYHRMTQSEGEAYQRKTGYRDFVFNSSPVDAVTNAITLADMPVDDVTLLQRNLESARVAGGDSERYWDGPLDLNITGSLKNNAGRYLSGGFSPNMDQEDFNLRMRTIGWAIATVTIGAALIASCEYM